MLQLMKSVWHISIDACITYVYHSDGMVGDVNLFFNEPNDTCLAEIEVMIAGT